MTRRGLLATVVAGCASKALAQDERTRLTFATHEPASAFVYSRIWKPWEDRVVRDAAGALEVQDLVRTPEVQDSTRNLELVERGRVDLAFIVIPLFAQRFPDQDLFMQPAMLRNSTEASLAATRLADRGLLAGFERVVPLAVMVAVPSLLHSTYLVERPQDLAGRRFNTSAPLVAEVFASLGAQMSQTYVTAQAAGTIARGEFDGVIADWVGSETFGTLKAAPYHLDYPLGGVMLAFVMNRARYDRLPPAARAAIDRNKGEALATAFGRGFDAGVAAVLDRIAADPTQHVFRPVGAAADAWAEAFRAPLARWRSATPRREALTRELQAELTRVREGQTPGLQQN